MKLNLGSGEQMIEGYVPYDVKLGREAYPLDVPDDSVDEIRASHVLEHFSHREVYWVVKHWVNKLKPGGILKIAVPDFGKLAHSYVSGENTEVCLYVMGGQVDDDDIHRCIFDESSLRQVMERAGLDDIQPWESEIEDAAALPISLNLMGRKRADAKHEVSIKAVMSMPRLAFTDNIFTAVGVLHPLGITLEWGTGVFWGQVLERLMTTHLHDGTEFILTLDYDTWFRREHVLRLCQLMAAHPEADAIFPMQVQRQRDLVMAGRADGEGGVRVSYTEQELAADLIPAATGHFGLTLIRVEALRGLPHPWFHSQPNPQGRWDFGRIDEDIWFWQHFRNHDRRAFLAPGVRIGHMELMCTFPTFDGTGRCVPAHVHIDQANRGEVPPGGIPNAEMESNHGADD